MAAHYTEEFKRSAIRRYEKGERLNDLNSELGVALSTLYQWRRRYASIPTPEHIYTPKELGRLREHLAHVEHQLAIIRETGYLSKVPLKNRLDLLEQFYRDPENPYSVRELCEALEVARGTFYNHIFRRADRTAEKAERERLMVLVQQVFDDNAQRFGAKKIHAILKENGTEISVNRISAMMKEMGLESVRTDAKKRYLRRQRAAKENLLNRDFTAEAPNQVWVSDITQFRVNGYWLYLCIMLDLFSRKIVGYRVSKNASTNLVTTAFRSAYQSRGCPKGLTFHSDRGAQYTAGAFVHLLEQVGVRQSFSFSGRPCDNAVAESFFSNFKKEEAYRREYTSEASFRKSVDQYIAFYNEKRPHRTISYQTPLAFEEAYHRKK